MKKVRANEFPSFFERIIGLPIIKSKKDVQKFFELVHEEDASELCSVPVQKITPNLIWEFRAHINRKVKEIKRKAI